MDDEQKTGINKAWAEAELTKKKKESIKIHPIPNDASIQGYDDLETNDYLWDTAKQKFLGSQFAVALVDRGENDKHICFEIFGEDDGHWFRVGHGSSSFWIDDLIKQLQLAKEYMEKHEAKDKDGYGHEFKER